MMGLRLQGSGGGREVQGVGGTGAGSVASRLTAESRSFRKATRDALSMSTGTKLLQACKEHVLETMKNMPECAPRSGGGAGYRGIEQAADFDLALDGQNGWLTWSLLIALAEDGKVEVVPGTERRRKYRLH